jgi:hypothetical protein
MSAPFIIPFNFQPVSTSVKTASYTIPAGKYARVKPLRADFTLNGVSLGVTAINIVSVSGSIASLSVSPLSGSVLISHTIEITTGSVSATGTIFTGTGSPAVGTISRTFIGSTTAAIAIPVAGVAFSISVLCAATANYSVTHASFSEPPDSFWIPSGVLTGSMYIVEEYNNIT